MKASRLRSCRRLAFLLGLLGTGWGCSADPPASTDAAEEADADDAEPAPVCPPGAALVPVASVDYVAGGAPSRVSIAADGREILLVSPSYDEYGSIHSALSGLRTRATTTTLEVGAELPFSGVPIRCDDYSGNFRLAGGDGYAVAWQSFIWNDIDLNPWDPHELIHVADPTRTCIYHLGYGWGDGAPCGAILEAWNGDASTLRYVTDIARSGETWTVMAAEALDACPPGSPAFPSPFCGCHDGYRTPPEPALLTSLRLYSVVPPPQEPVSGPHLTWSYDFSPHVGASVAVLRGDGAGVRLAFSERAPDGDPSAGWRIEVRSFDWTVGREPVAVLRVPADALGVAGPLEVADLLVVGDDIILAFFAGTLGAERTAHLAVVPRDFDPAGGTVRTSSFGTCLRSIRLAAAQHSALMVGLCREDLTDLHSPGTAVFWQAAEPAALLDAATPSFRIEPGPGRTRICQAEPAATDAGSYGLAVVECNESGASCDITLRLIGCP